MEGAGRGVGPRAVRQTPTPKRAAAPATRTHARGNGGPDKRSGHSDKAGRNLMTRQRRCRICHERPPWHGKNCPPGICKRCYHREIWIDRPTARRERHEVERAAAADPLADFAGPLVYDGYLDAFRAADLFSGDPLD